MRRLVVPDPYAAHATWTRRLAAAGGLLALLAVLLAHRPTVAKPFALVVLTSGLLCALTALMLAAKAARTIWRTGQKGTGRALAGLVVALVTLAYPGYLAGLALTLPFATAATTDPADPPRLSRSAKAAAVRGGLSRSDPVFAPASANLQPILLDLDAAEAFAAVQKAVGSLRWRSIEAVAPSKSAPGHLDAVTVSPVMRLPRDVAIRIKPLAGQTQVDVRVAERLGIFDFGACTALVHQFAAALEQQAEDQ